MADAALLPLLEQFAKETPKHFPNVRTVEGATVDGIGQPKFLRSVSTVIPECRTSRSRVQDFSFVPGDSRLIRINWGLMRWSAAEYRLWLICRRCAGEYLLKSCCKVVGALILNIHRLMGLAIQAVGNDIHRM
jgi:hypothetical protein